MTLVPADPQLAPSAKPKTLGPSVARRTSVAKIFRLHWNEAEAHERTSALRNAGHDVLLY